MRESVPIDIGKVGGSNPPISRFTFWAQKSYKSSQESTDLDPRVSMKYDDESPRQNEAHDTRAQIVL